MGTGGDRRFRALYLLLNDPVIRSGVVRSAAGGTATPKTRSGCGCMSADSPLPSSTPTSRRSESGRQHRSWAGPIEVYGLPDMIQVVRKVAGSKTYRDNSVLVTMKVLDAAGLLADTDTSGVAPIDARCGRLALAGVPERVPAP